MNHENAPWLSQFYRMTDQATQDTAERLLSRLDGLTIDTKMDDRGRSLLIVECGQETQPVDLYRFVMTVDPNAELIQSIRRRRRVPFRRNLRSFARPAM